MGGDQLRLPVPEVLEDLEHEVAVAARQVEELIPGDMGLGPLVVLVVHLDPVSAGRRHRLPMQAAVLNIRKFDFNRSQFRRLDGDCLLDNTQFLVESFTDSYMFLRLCGLRAFGAGRSRSHWVKRTSSLFSPRHGKKNLGPAL